VEGNLIGLTKLPRGPPSHPVFEGLSFLLVRQIGPLQSWAGGVSYTQSHELKISECHAEPVEKIIEDEKGRSTTLKYCIYIDKNC
jgi:hypothetical protein